MRTKINCFRYICEHIYIISILLDFLFFFYKLNTQLQRLLEIENKRYFCKFYALNKIFWDLNSAQRKEFYIHKF